MEKEVFEENETTALFSDSTDALRIAQTLVSFSNGIGGRIVFGVNTKTKVIGCDPNQIKRNLATILRNHCIGVVTEEPVIRVIQNKFLLEVSVQTSLLPASIVKWDSENGYYLRSGSLNVKAGKILTQFFRFKSELNSVKLNAIREDTELLTHFKNGTEWTLAQLYKTSLLSKSEIDSILPMLLLKGRIHYKIIDTKTYFY